jgi:hypothetical protein
MTVVCSGNRREAALWRERPWYPLNCVQFRQGIERGYRSENGLSVWMQCVRSNDMYLFLIEYRSKANRVTISSSLLVLRGRTIPILFIFSLCFSHWKRHFSLRAAVILSAPTIKQYLFSLQDSHWNPWMEPSVLQWSRASSCHKRNQTATPEKAWLWGPSGKFYPDYIYTWYTCAVCTQWSAANTVAGTFIKSMGCLNSWMDWLVGRVQWWVKPAPPKSNWNMHWNEITPMVIMKLPLW